MTTTPKPPKGRRWLREGEIIRRNDRYHWGILEDSWHATIGAGRRVTGVDADCCMYSRAIRRKTTRK